MQRERLVEFTAAAMKVIRGDAPFELSRLEIRRDYRIPTQLSKREADRPSPTSIH